MTHQELEHIFPTALVADNMFVLEQSPFSKYIVTDFYDGATKGFACVNASTWIYFTKTWWDDNQDLRVFGGYVLKDISDESRATLERCSIEDWSKKLPPHEAALLDELTDKAARHRDSKITIVCKDISRGLVIFSE